MAAVLWVEAAPAINGFEAGVLTLLLGSLALGLPTGPYILLPGTWSIFSEDLSFALLLNPPSLELVLAALLYELDALKFLWPYDLSA